MISDVRRAASELSEPERAELAAYLLGSLETVHHWVDDDELMRRSAELDSGEVKGLTREEFNQACGR
ncbi:MAG: addiction module protein [Akkermansiaceae bacterium]